MARKHGGEAHQVVDWGADLHSARVQHNVSNKGRETAELLSIRIL